MIMRLAYLTLDEVNQHQALTLATEHNVSLDVHARSDAIAEQEFDAVLYDPDSFPARDRQANLRTVLAGPLHHPVAVHSYNFSADQLEVLRARGVIVVVARRLEADVFAEIVNAVSGAVTTRRGLSRRRHVFVFPAEPARTSRTGSKLSDLIRFLRNRALD
jgi:hypothetical protein